MTTFEVKVLEVHSFIVTVEAEDEQAAQAAAEDIVACGCYSDDTDLDEPVYDYTIDRSEWPVTPM